MNGPEHYAQAERLLGGPRMNDDTGRMENYVPKPYERELATIHATLAQVAATLTAAEIAAGPSGIEAFRQHRETVFAPWLDAGVLP